MGTDPFRLPGVRGSDHRRSMLDFGDTCPIRKDPTMAKVASGNVLWNQRKRNWCRTPFTFTVYTLTDQELSIKTGVLNQKFNLIKLFRIKNRIAAGVGIGCSSHAGGTSKAMEIGDVEGAMSGVSIGIAGILTVVLAMFVR